MEALAGFAPLDADRLIDRIFAQYLTPPPTLTVSEWADQYRMLSRKAAAEPGPYRTDRTPYLREPMDMLSPSAAPDEVVLMFAAQVGKSEAGNNFIAYTIDLDPGPVMIVQPTIDLAKRYSRQRIASMVSETPALRSKVRDNRSRNEANTTLMKDFDGGVLVLAGANSAAGLRSTPVKKLFLDEIDAYPLDVDGEGDPVALAEKRTDTFRARRKILKTSTPTIKGYSRIEQAFELGDRRHFWVACVHCREYQVLKLDAIRWQRNAEGGPVPGTTRYVCPHCAAEMQETDKPKLLASGEWRAERPTERIVSYHLSALYSPWLTWEEIAGVYYQANEAKKQGDISKLKTFINTVLAETWEEQGDRISEHELAKRAEPFERGTVPMGGLMLTAGCDVQGDRLEYRVWAWGQGEESWCVDRDVLYGSPSEQDVWQQLQTRLAGEWQHASGARLTLSAAAIDSGGHHTHEVYSFCRSNAWRKWVAVKGQAQAGKPVIGKPTDQDVNYKGVKLRHGIKLWPVGSDTAKAVIYGRLRVVDSGPGYVHLPSWLPPTEYEELTAERLATRYVKGRPKLEWLKAAGRRNEALDCYVYALAAAYMLGMQRFRPMDWQRLRASVQQRSLLEPASPPPAIADTAEPQAPKAAETPATAVQPYTPPRPHAPRAAPHERLRKGFVGRWRK
ncbi:MAG: phage terminase large subunit family protein [Leptothrix sp. (in: b-proteobacteria)]